MVLAPIKFQRDSNRAYLTVRDRIGLTLSALQEGISGVRVIQALRSPRTWRSRRFERRNDSSTGRTCGRCSCRPGTCP
ncbi:MAG: hypothetical protein R2711_05480 [Acidimicrobiales bacterium]